MSDITLHVENLSKRYRLGALQNRHPTLQDHLVDTFRASLRHLSSWVRRPSTRSLSSSGHAIGPQWIWALKDVSFDVGQGEVVGVIGRNGAGKSTLLKILARVTQPTQGHATIYGRVGSLLEVGTGFHPELTGRENVYLNGAILGMGRRDIRRKFDEIVAFAELEKFIDTPVKRYSSGMYVRLGFAVAAHLEPDILLVDEVLAVGDAHFISKCTEKIRALRDSGMTIFLVTHSMWQVQTVCTSAICLDKGQVIASGAPVAVIGEYRGLIEKLRTGANLIDTAQEPISELGENPPPAKMISLEIEPDGSWPATDTAHPESGLRIHMTASIQRSSPIRFFARLASRDGVPYFTVFSDALSPSPTTVTTCRAWIPHLMLAPGDYVLWAGVCPVEDPCQVLAEGNIPFKVEALSTEWFDRRASLFWNRAEWEILNGPTPITA